MSIQEFIYDHLKKRLEKTVSLVIYDPDERYKEIVSSLAGDDCEVIDGTESTILGREHALDRWRRLMDDQKKQQHLVIYLPIRKPKTDEERQQDPYQIFAIGGKEFPRDDGDQYQALCHKAAPDLVGQIDELFKHSVPDFDTINNLIEGKANWPKLRTILKVESAVEILVSFLSPSPEQKSILEEDDSWIPEFYDFAEMALGLTLITKSKKWSKISEEVWRYLLYSEFTLDLPDELTADLEDVPRASASFKNLIYSVCETLRTSEKHQEIYMDMANKVDTNLQLAERMKDINEFGKRDTFSFQERFFLHSFVQAVLFGDTSKAEDVMQARKNSIWVRLTSERQVIWTTADRAFQLIVVMEDTSENLRDGSKSLREIFSFYSEEMRQIDRLHRDLERAVIDTFGELDSVGELVDVARERYLKLIEKAQILFVELVQKEGWPVSGQARNTEVFEKFVEPWLQERKKTAYFMVDALRYELGAELEKELSGEFKTELRAVCAQLPTITSVGMAALMPNADGNLRLVKQEENLVPYVKDQKVLSPSDRLECIRALYGDRCHMIELDRLLTKKPPKIPETVDILIIRTTDIDSIGESKPLDALRMFPDIVRKILSGVKKLRKQGFDRAVIATDHGFMLFSEREPGHKVEKPPGDWFMVKNRCLMGTGSTNSGTVAFKKEDVGIQGDFEQYAVPRTFATFVKGELYYHSGLSLQECILPVISADLSKGEEKPKRVDLHLSYKGGATDRITTRRPMIEIAVFQTGLFEEELEFQLEAYEKRKVVGEVGTSNHVNPATNLVKIRVGEAIKVPLKMDDDFHGSFEVRATDPVTRINYATLKLKTDYMD